MSESFYIEITSAERDELDAIIERWGNPDNYATPAERLMVSGLYPLLLQLKSVTTVPIESATPPVNDWFDVPEITDSEQLVNNNPYAPINGVQHGSTSQTNFDLPDGVEDLGQIDDDMLSSDGFKPVGTLDPKSIGQEFTEFVAGSTLVEL